MASKGAVRAVLDNLPVAALARKEGPLIAVSIGTDNAAATNGRRTPRVPGIVDTLMRTMLLYQESSKLSAASLVWPTRIPQPAASLRRVAELDRARLRHDARQHRLGPAAATGDEITCDTCKRGLLLDTPEQDCPTAGLNETAVDVSGFPQTAASGPGTQRRSNL